MNLYRSKNHRIIAGVVGGLAERFGWNVTLLRFIWILLTITPLPGLIIYLILWLILPEKDD
ncbi:PspC domain-containing protein [Weissella paramesenteroides]|jgi:phage shock protein C|uniref:PspC domain-containing protein n=1 Tax=Weissella paramesenteroides TaxID=1249 RepID=A0A5M9EK80_WEIPA|nr:PspC domain-containing protein [Weissella paramesenteroides]KAA8441957.1 PspC domain-containing protein [Weissella paramesenteroides]KAA8442201.1 PspC domain-containing protein [Weissella paramesenteroides]KAA8443594.1 PspC domain-containing protein [Weissella paramesenteroides]KAA8447096.1 PspC domain-containing protein [Weissella paramesenteroides]KAA8447453.1 PspC domain-containing protein [Weissella paramesenteroides]